MGNTATNQWVGQLSWFTFSTLVCPQKRRVFVCVRERVCVHLPQRRTMSRFPAASERRTAVRRCLRTQTLTHTHIRSCLTIIRSVLSTICAWVRARAILTDGGHKHDDEAGKHGDVVADPTHKTRLYSHTQRFFSSFMELISN